MLRPWLGIILAVALTAGPAVAGETQCLWDKLPSQKRTVFLAQARVSPPQAVGGALFSDPELGAAVLACGIKTADAPAARGALTGYAFDAAIVEWMAAHEKIDADKLDAAWSGLPESGRSALVKLAKGGAGQPDPETFKTFAAGVGAGDRTDLMSSDFGQYLFMYMMGRALRAANEPNF